MTILDKYANLPDIDVNSPDTFENKVEHLPCLETQQENSCPNVETSCLNVKAATNTFREKEKMISKSYVWNNESKAQKLHYLTLQLFDLKEQLLQILQEDDGSQESLLSKIRSLEEDIQSAIVSTNEAKNNSWNYLDGISMLRNSLPLESKDDGPLVLELYSSPSSIRDSEQFVKLESRVSTLEKMIGASINQPYLDLDSTNILATLDKLNGQISFLINSDFQDETIKKLEKLTVNVDGVKMEKTSQMHRLLNSEYLPLVPQILSRLMTLKDTHDYSIQMVKRFKELESVVENDHQIVDDLKNGIKTLEEVMEENSKEIQLNLSKIIDKCKNLEKRIESLHKS